MNETLQVTEIYQSIQGEAGRAGYPCTFIRLTGCPLRCRWCDTAYAFAGGNTMSVAEVLKAVDGLGVPLVELTGGEPMAQAGTIDLARALVARGYHVMIETGGSLSVASLPREVHIILDLKAPGSGMEQHNLWDNLSALKPSDEIKFVLAHRDDFEWAVKTIARERLDTRFQVLLSCAFGLLKPADLAAWMLEVKLNRCRLQLQQHKYIWSPRARGV